MLRLHVEWAQGFTLIFLFSSNRRLLGVFKERLERIYQVRVSHLEVLAPQVAENMTLEVVEWIRKREPLWAEARAPLWLDLVVGKGEEWNKALNNTMARVNERRELLMAHKRPVVMVLPADHRNRVRTIAPDLWSIRTHSLDMDGPGWLQDEPTEGVEVQPAERPAVALSAGDEALVREWERLAEQGSAEPGVLRVGVLAAQALLDARQLERARKLADDVLASARRQDRRDHLEAELMLGWALSAVGDVAVAQGRLEEAEGAYKESLELRRALRERVGEVPQVLRDLSVSHNKVGNVAVAQGRLEEAEGAYRESLELRRALRGRLGDTLQVFQDLNWSLRTLGSLTARQGRSREAISYYEEALSLGRRLALAFPNIPDHQEQVREMTQELDQLRTQTSTGP